jgi:hypothetical protein
LNPPDRQDHGYLAALQQCVAESSHGMLDQLDLTICAMNTADLGQAQCDLETVVDALEKRRAEVRRELRQQAEREAVGRASKT